MHLFILKEPPVDSKSFPQMECVNSPDWKRAALAEIARGRKFVLYGCSQEELSEITAAPTEHEYVVMVHPYPDTPYRTRAYFRPERRKLQRVEPVEADDETEFFERG